MTKRHGYAGHLFTMLRVHAHGQQTLDGGVRPTTEPVAGLAARKQEAAAEIAHVALDQLLCGQREGLVRHVRDDHEIVAFELAQGGGEGGGRTQIDVELLGVQRAQSGSSRAAVGLRRTAPWVGLARPP